MIVILLIQGEYDARVFRFLEVFTNSSMSDHRRSEFPFRSGSINLHFS